MSDGLTGDVEEVLIADRLRPFLPANVYRPMFHRQQIRSVLVLLWSEFKLVWKATRRSFYRPVCRNRAVAGYRTCENGIRCPLQVKLIGITPRVGATIINEICITDAFEFLRVQCSAVATYWRVGFSGVAQELHHRFSGDRSTVFLGNCTALGWRCVKPAGGQR